jgi:hypothetical protein
VARIRIPIFFPPGPVSTGLRRWLLEPLLFVVLAVAATWPLATHLVGHLPLGSEEAATVPLFNLWIMWWNSDRVAAGFADYWQAPIFYPARDALAFSEPLSPSVILAPLFWLGLPPELIYNLVLLAILAGNGWAACALLRWLRLHPSIPLLGGALTVCSPLLLSWLGVLQLVALFPTILVLLALDRLRRRPTLGRGLLLGAALALTALSCSYYGLFLMLPLAVATLCLFGRALLDLRTLAGFVAALLFCGLLLLPQLLVQRRAIGDAMSYDLRTLASLSAVAADYLVPPRPSFLVSSSLAPVGHEAVFKLGSGLVLVGLGVVGVLYGLSRRRFRSWIGFWLLLGGCAFLLSLGPLLTVGGLRPYLFLLDHLPGFAQARNIMRFAVFVHLAVMVLACIGLQGVVVWLKYMVRRQRWPIRPGLVLLTLGLAAALEIPPAPQRLFPLPLGGAEPAWVSWFRQQPDPHLPIVCFPFAFKPDVASYQQEALWMYWQTMHRRPLLNGYSAHFPEDFKAHKWPLATFPSPVAFALLQSRGVRYCVVQNPPGGTSSITSAAFATTRLIRVFGDTRAGVEIFLIEPMP